MKLKTLATVIASAFCTSSLAAAVATHPSPGLHQIKAAQLAKSAQVSATQQQEKTSIPNRRRPGGVNQQIRPASSADKFAQEPERSGEDVYIVRLNDLPVATYDGRVKGHAATAKSALRAEAAQGLLSVPRGPRGLDTIQQNRAVGYKNYLQQKQQMVVQEARGLGVKRAPRLQFTDALNGFTIKMTQKQAKKLAESPQVAFVQRSDTMQLHTDRGPEFIGADKIWNGETSASSLKQKGEGMIVGILDTGINTDHISFADIGDDGYDHANPWGTGVYVGDCATGASTCNDKLIGVWSWSFITDTYNGVRPASGEDYNGHGSHTASTTAGNVVHNVPYTGGSLGDGDGIPTGFEFDQASGVAPHANIISYQVCFADGRGCPTEVTLKAVDQAIADGVDVINFSIGGGDQYPWDDATALAFLAAREAGISIAASAGNAGPGFYTLSHTAPWYTVVAASTSDRKLEISGSGIEANGGATEPPIFYNVAGFSSEGITGTPVSAADYGDELCLNEFAADTFTSDQIVICKRGQNARVAKAFNVKAGGAGGFVLYNAPWYDGITDEEQKLYDDIYPLPGVHVNEYRGADLLNWIADGGTDHSLSISAGSVTRTLDPSSGDLLADFSSRGPAQHFTGSLAPHISAPGVDILAAWADEHPFHPDSAASQDWSAISGTSMASPHVAGAMTLVRQVHPDWTAAEVQSALLMTAAQTVREPINDWTEPHPVHTYRAGSGRVDVEAAANAGLVMNETAANFEYANPNNGGDVKQLNLPQLVDNNCRKSCSWIRTVRATRDGEWAVSNGDWTYDVWNTGEGETPINGAKIEAFPSSFKLLAGQTQTIVFRADLTDVQFGHNSQLGGVDELDQVELWSEVRFTPKNSNSSIPEAHWPVSINFDRGGLPSAVNVEVHRNNGAYHLKDLPLPAMNSVQYRGFGPVKAKVEEITLNQDIDHIPVRYDDDYEPGHVRVTLTEIPENTARLVVEVLENVKSPGWHEWYGPLHGWMTVYIGRDANGDGVADFDSELLCASTTESEMNYCSITNPDAGMYWVMVDNHRVNGPDHTVVDGVELKDTYKVATAVVPATAGGLQVEGPAKTTGNKVGLELKWNLTDFMEGDVAYAGFDIGTSNAPGSVGFVPVKLTRGVNDISLTTSQTQAKGGDVIDVTVHMVENNSGIDREIDLIGQLPEGLTLVDGSVKVTNPAMRGGLMVNGDLIQVTGAQENSEHWKPDYKVTTSKTDQMCRTPIYTADGVASEGGFVGLYQRFGLLPDFGGTAMDWTNPEFTIPLSWYWGEGAGMNLFHNEAYKTYPNLSVSPQGYATLEQFEWSPNQHWIHREFPSFPTPYAPFIGVFWKGVDNSIDWFDVKADLLGTPLNPDPWDPELNSGMVLGYAHDPENNIDDIIIEWNNARTQMIGQDPETWELVVQEDKSDRYNFNLIVHKGYRYGEGEFEFTMAYGNLDFAGEAGAGSVGLHGNYGPMAIVDGLPLYFDQEVGKNFAFNDLNSKLKKDLVVCYDYVGPESTQFDLKFQVRVAETAAGQDLELAFLSDIDGMAQEAVAQIIVVPGNLTLSPIADQAVELNTTLEGLEVVYLDKVGDPNTIEVSGEHISATVSGHTSGSTISITPEADWHGATEVTVTVTDELVPTDKASTTFSLTVLSGAMTLTPIEDQTVDENTTLEGVEVLYEDLGNAGPNTIEVSGEHISATVSGHTSGSTISITPDANWYGETEVTVTVTDNVVLSDMAITTFTLTVNSDGIELGCTDSDATNYDSGANQDDGSCYFPKVPGCTDPEATNYNPLATKDDGNCTYPEPEPVDILGCMDESAFNYNPAATVDDGSCTKAITLTAMGDHATEENTAMEMAVAYEDLAGGDNTISVTGEHISATLSGNTSGSMVTITPHANWYGQTAVTVTVTDNADSTQTDSQTFTLTVNSDGMDLTLSPIEDQTTEENTATEGLEVVYEDMDSTPNTISVSGEHVSATVSGHTSGSKITITPEANWYGETQVTVTVTDNEEPADTVSQTFTLTVESDGLNLIIEPIENQIIDENTVLEGLKVLYEDTEGKVPNTIEVSGDHITAEVSDHTSGSEITITPDANWHGETVVTVTVTDDGNSLDTASIEFLLTVESDGVERQPEAVLGCTDANATNYNANATQDNGSCTFKKKKKSGLFGGSMGLTLFGLLFALGLGRRYRLAIKQR